VLLKHRPAPNTTKKTRAILAPILRDIENLCLEKKIPVRNGVVYDIAPEFGLLASQREVMQTDVSIIDVSPPFIIFCNCVGKLFARSLLREGGPPIQVCYDPDKVLAKFRTSPRLIGELRLTILHFAYGWVPPNGISPPPDELGRVTRILLLRAMEWFAIGHEYGHHVMKHGQATSSAEACSIFNDEHQADFLRSRPAWSWVPALSRQTYLRSPAWAAS
jgi:hypothetical protein